ncbi:hypothetical protein KQH82_08225 [bacterium]|nr:hypothetical protein [bacterium]
MRFAVIAPLLILMLFGAGSSQAVELTDAQIDTLVNYVSENAQSPIEYVLSKFDDHDVVILGEPHYVKQHVEFVRNLIPALHKDGINRLATEYLRRVDQTLLDSLITAPVWDEQLAREITMRSFVYWGFQEYVYIYKAAWSVNQQRAESEPRFRIIAMGGAPDWSILKKPEDRRVDSLRRQVWHGETEGDWAKVVLEEVAAGEKVLAYCGAHHAFSRDLQPLVGRDGFSGRFEMDRFGRYVHEALGERAMTVMLHYAWAGAGGYSDHYVRPAGGMIDTVMALLGSEHYPAGFDVVGSPFVRHEIDDAVYRHGYEPFTLDEYCDGWIYFCPFAQVAFVTPIQRFYNESNIDYARRNSWNPHDRDNSIEEFTRDLQDVVDKARNDLSDLY